MEKPFYVTDGLNKIGPFSKEEVYQLIYGSHISLMDFIIDSRDNRMCPLLQHEDFGGEGATHSITSNTGIAGLTPKSLSNKYGFGELRKSQHKEREQKIIEKKERRPRPPQESHLKEVIAANPSLAVPTPESTQSKIDYTRIQPTPKMPDPAPAPAPAKTEQDEPLEINENTTSFTLKTNNSLGFYIKVKGKEFGPLKFLILLSLLKQNKIGMTTYTRSQADSEWRFLSDFLPTELQKSIHISPVISSNLLPKTHWKRKNVRVDYDEMVMLNNARYSLVAKSIDISAEGIAVVWVYDIPVNEEFEISIFDVEKNMVTVKAILTRKEPLENTEGFPLFKAVFIFKNKIPIKSFIS